MAKHVYGIDFGTSHIKLYDGITKKLLEERNLIAIKDKTEIFGFGDAAFLMYEKAPSNISITYPIKDGVIADLGRMTRLFECFFQKINFPKKRKSGDFCIALPSDISDVEKRAFYDLVADSKMKAKDIVIVDKPLADAIGCGLDVLGRRAHLIIDIGADTTEISVVSLGGIVISKILKVGGNTLDEAIAHAIRQKYNMMIGLKTAETIKITLSNAMPAEDEMDALRIFGRDIITGFPCEKSISASLVNQEIHNILTQMADAIHSILDRTPPDLAANIAEDGIYLTGGSSQIPNIDDLLSQNVRLPVNLTKKPTLSVIKGISVILDNPEYKDLLYTPRDNDEY